MVICLKKVTEKVKKKIRHLLFGASSQLTGWGLHWKEVKCNCKPTLRRGERLAIELDRLQETYTVCK